MIEVNVKEDSKISRYLNLTKFLDFVQFNRLYFRQVDKYDDVLEGCFTKQIYELGKCITITGANGAPSNKGIIEQTKYRRQSSYVSCWSLCEHESMGMWSVYGGQNGLAIQTTVSLLKRKLENAPRIFDDETHKLIKLANLKVSGIHYIDHSNEDHANLKRELISNPIFLKNIGYSYENEVRFLYDTGTWPTLHPRLGDGFFIKMDAKDIIEKILVSPTAEEWFFELVKGILTKYGLDDHVFWSNLRFPPYNENDFQ
jgi:hypothetical protein